MNSLISSQEEMPVGETVTEVVESTDLGGSPEDLVESVKAVAAEPVDAALNDPQPATN